MNRFRTKKKAKDDSIPSRPSLESENSSLSFFRRGKKSQEEEQKKEIDLTSALPPSDDFRTSLLMTGLSARFSMLREQDDPNTKIGKASDDSVLFPKRQSRLMDFGYGGGLADIAEVESIRGAPFARVDSFASDDLGQGSVMNRAKPIEGNNLFGGRQKIYKIPVGGSTGRGVAGMGGRALYEDDVSLSAFQKWRQAEKERNSFDEDERYANNDSQTFEGLPATRSESPLPLGYNRKRETSSTTSSTPSLARNSTAATSVTSQPTAPTKDWQFQSSAPASSSSTPLPERSVTRTRRLYEQGLTQDLHDHQSSALSRIDTLSRQRPLGARTPDLTQNSPSPTTLGFGERFGGERRPILTKGSAPNLRSMSPPTTGSSMGTIDLGIKLPVNETKSSFGGSPPLSPPISETGEHPLLPIQPNDRGKATAMGVFQKPLHSYDESKYAQRQLQLQQGRETPTQRFRAESNASFATDRSRSSSSVQRRHNDGQTTDLTIKTGSQVPDDTNGMSFLDDSEDSPILKEHPGPLAPPQVAIQRPSDLDHPAFRQAAMPTPLSMSSQPSEEPSPILEHPGGNTHPPRQETSGDSPTLGPTTGGGLGAGLSGMVRQHLRSESNASSIYDRPPQTAGADSSFPIDPRDSSLMKDLGAKSNPWQDNDWDLSNESDDRQHHILSLLREEPLSDQETVDQKADELDGDQEDEFANQLANARRRVREKLTSYVESDSRSGSPRLAPAPTTDLPLPPSRSNPLGILRAKSSRGSLIDRTRTRDESQTKAMKMLGIGASTMSTSPSPGKQSFDEKDIMPTMSKENVKEQEHDVDEDHDADARSTKSKDEENVHPGLRAFRQARRELQRRKELETLAKHQVQPGQTTEISTSQPRTSPPRETGMGRQRTPSRERKPPPVYYQQRAPSEASQHSGSSQSRSESRTDRDRSGSDTSYGESRSRSRPPRIGNASSPYEDHAGQSSLNPPSRQPMLRSPGLPGTDIRRSPIMPPQGYAQNGAHSGAPSPQYFDRSASAGNLSLQPVRPGYESMSTGQPSPISPLGSSMGLPRSPYSANGSGITTPTAPVPSPRRPSAPSTPGFSTTASTLNESLKKVVKKNDISEPTFIMSTSRVPTVSLPQSNSTPEVNETRSRSGSRSRAGSNAGHTAPPLPPINPRRKREGSNTRGVFGGQGSEEPMSSVSTPHLPLSNTSQGFRADHNTGFPASDDEDGRLERRRQWKAKLEANSRGSFAVQTNNGPYVAAGPPASRSVITSNMKGPSPSGMGLPGGMI